MEIDEYFGSLSEGADRAYAVAEAARRKGYDPETFVEIKPAPDIASKVEGIIGLDGIAGAIREKQHDRTRQELAFEMVKEICTNEKFAMDTKARIILAVRIGLSILTEGILVAPTEGMPTIEMYKNPDGTDYIAMVYAGPIRAAGGTSAALSVALGDYARKFFNIDQYKPQRTEVERYLEEIQLYHTRSGKHLQYLPSESDIKTILENCPVCVDGVPTEMIEVSVHRNVKRIDANGAEKIITNRVRGGVALVVCEGIAQKAKSVLKYSKAAGLDWNWLNSIIRVGKATAQQGAKEEQNDPAFLTELVGGRPVIAYPDYRGGFRLRYGRSRLTGIAAKGFSPATMTVLEDFIVIGTQVKIEKPGKGSVAMPVDTIEGPFVKLKSGEAFRVNTAEHAKQLLGKIDKILSVGDMLITYGDFKKTNTPLIPSSYVEEFWYAQLKKNGYKGEMPNPESFESAYRISKEHNVPLHPRYLYEYQDMSMPELESVVRAVASSSIKRKGESVFDVDEITIGKEAANAVRVPIEILCIPHFDDGEIKIYRDDAQSLLVTLGFTEKEKVKVDQKVIDAYKEDDMFKVLNSLSPVVIMQRSSRIGARIGRPEKARERLMKPAPNMIFPIGENGGKERNISKAYYSAKKQFRAGGIDIDMANYKCIEGGEPVSSFYCKAHGSRAFIERRCSNCGRIGGREKCESCGGPTTGSTTRSIDIIKEMDAALDGLQINLAKTVKGVKGLMNTDKIPEPLEKGILRSNFGIYTFKDGTCRFDATDAPMTHFYPKEVGVDIGRLSQLGYEKDFEGKKLERDDQLLELKHQDVIINRRCAEYMLNVTRFVDALLERYYGLGPFYNAKSVEDLVGQLVITLSPHTSAGVLGRIIGFSDALVGFAHPYTISARRRNCDGDEDTTMMLLDGLINFSRRYLPSIIGGTMDAPLILSINIAPEEVDDEVWCMETISNYGIEFYEKTLEKVQPSEAQVGTVNNRLNTKEIFDNLLFTHVSTIGAIADSPKKSVYTKLKTMDEKVELQFKLMDKLYSIDKRDTARRLISSHFMRDLMGNLHSYSEQGFRCVSCNAKYRRIPLVGKCTRCNGKIILTISKGGIEKYLTMATNLADRYDLEPYMKQRLRLIKDEIETVFGTVGTEGSSKQFNLSKFM
ncbi:MAG TPA: DNA polymerase II large subunit [Candidatus Acidoferrum sp.]|nr:DNA polymerase II large subunit [Candidatus Acidoferrum sp.]